MTTATAEKSATPKNGAKAAPAPSSPARILYQGVVDIDKIDVGYNPRKVWNPKKLEELTESVRRHGVNQPVLLRPNQEKTGRYWLVAGARRIKASLACGFHKIPAMVKELTADQGEIDQIIENLDREDLGPVEQARGFKKLLDAHRYDAAALAQLVDKSESYVYRGLKLLELPEAGIAAIEAGKIPVSFGHLIASTAPQYHERLVKYATTKQQWSDKFPTFDDLKDEIRKTVAKPLSHALFPQAEPYAGEVACAACPFNTGNQDMLIPGAKDGSCTNGACFGKKQRQAEKDFEAKAASRFKGLQSLGTCRRDYSGNPVAPKGGVILDRAAAAKLKKLVDTEPDKFAYVVAKPATYGTKELAGYLVCTDPKVLPKGMAQERPNYNSYQAPAPKTEKEKFIEEAIEKGLEAAELKVLPEVTEARIRDYFRAEWARNPYERQEAKKVGADVKNPTTAEVLRRLFLKDLDENCACDEHLEAIIGMDEANLIKAQILREAEAAWAKKHPVKAAKKA